MDGLNLVAKEAPLVNTRDGVVVLSENAGAYEELGEWAVSIDPFDVDGQAEALEQALALPRRRARRAARGDPRARARRTTWRRGSTRAAGRPRPRRVRCGGVSDLSHVDESGSVRMVDVGGKPMSRRRAVARASVRMAPETAQRLRSLPKGDALATAQLAGIMAAKRTSDLIPLCHPLPLSRRRRLARGRRRRRRDHRRGRDDRADGRRDGGARRRLGRGADRLRHGEGDRQGDGHRRGRLVEKTKEDGVKAAVLTVSDGVVAGTREDKSGDLLAELLAADGYEVERARRPRRGGRDRRGDRRARRDGAARAHDGRHRRRAA